MVFSTLIIAIKEKEIVIHVGTPYSCKTISLAASTLVGLGMKEAARRTCPFELSFQGSAQKGRVELRIPPRGTPGSWVESMEGLGREGGWREKTGRRARSGHSIFFIILSIAFIFCWFCPSTAKS